MFEENKKDQPQKGNNPAKTSGDAPSFEATEKEPEDMFAQTEKLTMKPPAKRGKEIFDFEGGKPPSATARKIITIIIGFLVICSLAYGAYIVYSKYQQADKEKGPAGLENTNQPETEVKIPVTAKDTDNDGLSDQEEIGLGTRIDKIDTDGDGLSDREEVKVYNTDPLEPDTDGDGFLDGQEVRVGYDPNNPAKGAKLLDLREEIEKLK